MKFKSLLVLPLLLIICFETTIHSYRKNSSNTLNESEADTSFYINEDGVNYEEEMRSFFRELNDARAIVQAHHDGPPRKMWHHEVSSKERTAYLSTRISRKKCAKALSRVTNLLHSFEPPPTPIANEEIGISHVEKTIGMKLWAEKQHCR